MSDENLFENLEIEALSDEDLEAVAGGTELCDRDSCSKQDCSCGGDNCDDTTEIKVLL